MKGGVPPYDCVRNCTWTNRQCEYEGSIQVIRSYHYI